MSGMADTSTGAAAPRLDRYGVQRILTVLGFTTFVGVILFVAAGRLNWWNAWAYLGLSLLNVLAVWVFVGRRHPEVINARGRGGENAEKWDKLFAVFYIVLTLAGFVVAGLDGGRFGWSHVPLGVVVLGVVLAVLAMIPITWAMAVNAYFETMVRIQEDRGHQVVTDGPYRFVRHPGYLSMIMTQLANPLLFGSWWALIPGVLAVAAFVYRTAREDRTLHASLPGYRDYAQRTRYRLLPGVW